MKTLLILRHAKSSWKHTELADFDRPLKKRGHRACHKIGHLLRVQDLVPQHILSSAAKRAHDTAECVAKECSYEGDITFTRALYAAGPMAYIEALQQLNDSNMRVMIVGHNPGMEVLLEALTGKSEWLPTAALAHLTLPITRWQDLAENTASVLVNLWLPRQLS